MAGGTRISHDATGSPDSAPRTYDDLWDRPGYLVRRLHQIHTGLFMEECAGHDLTAAQYAILSILNTHDGLDQLSLSMAVGIDRTSGADIIKRLSRRGLVSRRRSQTDRRAMLVHVTEDGRAVVTAMRPAMERAQEKLLAPLGPDDRRRFMEMIRHLVEANNDASRARMG